ncbi:MAG: hypothetical protein J6C28_06550 [Bacilli bacterium]|nr:hypothetical protein [Bacilli bacterium]
MDKKDDSIEKLNEQIKKLENSPSEEVKEKESTTKVFSVSTDTKVFDKDDLVSDDEDIELLDDLIETKKTDVVEEAVKEETKEESITEEVVEEKKFPKKKMNGKNIAIIALLISIFVVLGVIVTCVVIFSNKDNKPGVVEEDTKLTEKEMEELIISYGEALEGVINIYYSKQGVLLEYNDAVKLVDFEEEINCTVHDIYKDGKVYLDKCSINGIKTKYTYGTMQVDIESEDEILKVYVEKVGKKVSLEVPKGATYDTYTVHCGGKYSEPEIIGDYVIYFDSDYILHMKNYKTDENVLKNVSYQTIWPIRVSESNYDSTYLLVKISNFWGVYNYVTGEQVISPMYTGFLPSASGIVGNSKAVVAIANNKIVAWNGTNYGVIDYTTNRTIIPFDYVSITLKGNDVWALMSDGTGHIYDTDGKRLLENSYDKIYGMASSDNILVKDKENIKLIKSNGEVVYDYGNLEKIGNFNFSIYYQDQAIFQFYEGDSINNCVEVVYNTKTKEGNTKSVICGGLAKPILYLYPKEKTKVSVTFEHPEYLKTTYPKFNISWEVVADVDGTLTDKNNKNYYALYWDEKKVHSVDFSEGYYVHKDNAIKFLENKLDYIGFTEREANEFIMYWLPILEDNVHSLVYFELTDERESYNKINISPNVDSLLRVVIHIKKVDKKVDIKKQSLVKFKRKGFVAVEWGGTTY